MSSSTDHGVQPSRVLRDVESRPMPTLVDLDTLTGAARRAVDPAAVVEAQARGYEDGRAEGYRDGHAAGRQEAIDDVARADTARRESVDAAVGALARAAAELTALRASDLIGIEDALVDGALELATAVIGRELELATAPGRDALARALRLAESREPVLARLHPDDVATLGEHAELAPGRDVTVLADPSVERGGCLLELGEGRVDARITTALARVRQELTL